MVSPSSTDQEGAVMSPDMLQQVQGREEKPNKTSKGTFYVKFVFLTCEFVLHVWGLLIMTEWHL